MSAVELLIWQSEIVILSLPKVISKKKKLKTRINYGFFAEERKSNYCFITKFVYSKKLRYRQTIDS